jgi:transketolase central region
MKKATRQSYGEILAKLGKKDKNIIVFDADLSSSTKTNIFGEKFKDRFFNVGISEQNMIGMASRNVKNRKNSICIKLCSIFDRKSI